MLKMYHYSKHGNTVLKDGLFGIRKSGRSLALYAHRAQTEEPEKFMNGWIAHFRAEVSRCLV